MPDYTPRETTATFKAATGQAATATVELDAALVAWFQQQQGPDWREGMNSALRSFMEDVQAMDRAAPPEPDAAREAERQAALDAMIDRHQAEYEDVHNGSGRSEEFPSDLDARHAEEWRQFERRHPEQAPAMPTTAAPPKPGM